MYHHTGEFQAGCEESQGADSLNGSPKTLEVTMKTLKQFSVAKAVLLLILSLILFVPGSLMAQAPEWMVYNTSNSGLRTNWVECLAIDAQGKKWIGDDGAGWAGSGDGLISFDPANGTWSLYNTSNSGLPSNSVYAIAIDASGNKWVGTRGYTCKLTQFDGTYWTTYTPPVGATTVTAITIDGSGNKWIGVRDDWGSGRGLLKFDGTNWTIYDQSNSGLPDNTVYAIAIDGSGNKWIATGNGLAKFDGTNWSVYYTSSGLPKNDVRCIAIDAQGNKWIGTSGGGSARFDGANWTVYNTSNSGLPSDYVYAIAIDVSGNKWIGTYAGLAKFDGVHWIVYNRSNSRLPGNWVTVIRIDRAGNKWIGTDGGLAVYREGGVILAVDEKENKEMPTSFALLQNYPNPFNPSTTISFEIPHQSHVKLVIYDVLGREVRTLVDEEKAPGRYTVNFDASNLPSGVYLYRLSSGNFNEVRRMVVMR